MEENIEVRKKSYSPKNISLKQSQFAAQPKTNLKATITKIYS